MSIKIYRFIYNTILKIVWLNFVKIIYLRGSSLFTRSRNNFTRQQASFFQVS